MTRDDVKAVLDRVLEWSPERQAAAAQFLLMLESRSNLTYEPSEEEWAAINEGLAQAERGEFASEEEVAALWERWKL